MWEITLLGDTSDYLYFVALEQNLKDTLKDNVIVAITSKDVTICSIAIKQRKYINYAKISIIESIIKSSKEKYFNQNLVIEGCDNDLKNFIIMSLIYVNIQDEIDYARIKIKFSRKLCIESLMKFRLNKLYNIWDKLITYFNYKLSFINDSIYLEFLKIFADNIRTKSEILFVKQKKDKMYLMDDKQTIISESLESDEIGLIVNLILLAPKKIIINCSDNLSARLKELIHYIFEDRLSVIL